MADRQEDLVAPQGGPVTPASGRLVFLSGAVDPTTGEVPYAAPGFYIDTTEGSETAYMSDGTGWYLLALDSGGVGPTLH